jgi:tripartite-type tricarboxylate transporter receptor subunit TctC
MARLPILVLTLVLAALPGAASAQTYPGRAITIVVPFTPGTGIDIIARILGQRIAERWGQPVVIDNKPGASGNIGTEAVARARPDGHALLMTVNTFVMNHSLFKSVPYDPLRDFEPIGLAAWGSLLMVANASAPFDSVAALVRAAKAQPGKIAYASPGVGTPHHMSMELFKNVAGIDLLHVPYKGTAGAVNDLLSGQVPLMFLPIHVALPHVKSGRIRALAIGSPQRAQSAPDVPTLRELGLNGVDVDMWYGLVAPRATPREIIAKWNAEMKAILGLAEVRASFAAQGLEPAYSTPEEFRALIETDLGRWTRVVREAKISAD